MLGLRGYKFKETFYSCDVRALAKGVFKYFFCRLEHIIQFFSLE